MGSDACQPVIPLRRTALPRIKGIAHVELSVSNLDVSAAWYTALLGARETFRAANDAYDIVACALREPVSGMVIAFTQHGRMHGGTFTPRRVGLDHLAFGVALEFICPPRKPAAAS
jgi:glyoxylase I family protein